MIQAELDIELLYAVIYGDAQTASRMILQGANINAYQSISDGLRYYANYLISDFIGEDTKLVGRYKVVQYIQQLKRIPTEEKTSLENSVIYKIAEKYHHMRSVLRTAYEQKTLNDLAQGQAPDINII